MLMSRSHHDTQCLCNPMLMEPAVCALMSSTVTCKACQKRQESMQAGMH